MVILAVITFVAGLLIGCVGAGGFFLIPALNVFADISTHTAMATALFSFIFTGTLGTFLYLRRRSIDWELTIPLCLASIVTSYPGSLANAVAPARLLNIILAGIIIFAGVYALKPQKPPKDLTPAMKRNRRLLLIGIGAAVGFASGLTGVGGPVLSVPIMISFGFPPLATIAASQVLQITASSSGSIGNFQNGFIDFSIAWWVILLELTGVGIGVWLAHRTPGGTLKKIVSVVCIFVGLYMLIKWL